MMSYGLLALQLVLSGVLVTASVSKIVRSEVFLEALRAGLPKRIRATLGVVVPGIEMALGALVLSAPAPLTPSVFAACLVLITAFTGWMVWVYARGLRIRCGCFGSGVARVGPPAIARNVLLAGVAAGGLVLPPMFRLLSPRGRCGKSPQFSA